MKSSRLRVLRVRPLAVVAAIALLLAVGGGWLWLRDSSLVAVQRVAVVGASGPDSKQIQRSLRVAGRSMTTLDVNVGALHRAVSQFPVVKDLRVSTHFPHGLTIRVIEQVPVAVIVADGRRIAVAGDGTLLRDVHPGAALPQLSVRVLPEGNRVRDPRALEVLAVLGAAPWQLLGHVTGASGTADHGIVVQLRQGPRLYFGDSALLGAKWVAADDVLADPGSAGASYIDVTDPYRPAAGVETSSSSTQAAGTGTASGPSASAGGAAASSPAASAAAATPSSPAASASAPTASSPAAAASAPTASSPAASASAPAASSPAASASAPTAGVTSSPAVP